MAASCSRFFGRGGNKLIRSCCTSSQIVCRKGKHNVPAIFHQIQLPQQQVRCCTVGVDAFPRYQSRFSDDGEEEYEEEANDEELERLRRLHREEAKKQHMDKEGMNFSDFPISEELANRLETLGYSKPFEIQTKTLNHTLNGRNVIGRAVTGSGKTMAFSIPIVQKISSQKSRRFSKSPRAIVISPTRELCMQIYRSIQELDPSVRCVALYGGDSINKQTRAISRGIDVVCATPGRLNDHLQRNSIDLRELQFLCLDEADELLTPNFKDQIEDVLENSPSGKQMLMFSATMPPDAKRIAHRYMTDPQFVDITSNQRYKSPESVQHKCMKVHPSQNMLVCRELLTTYKPERCIIFMETKVKTRDTASALRRSGLAADGLHSDLSQSRREVILAAFRQGRIKVLVATDVAARGLDIPEVDLIIQAGPPVNGVDYYIHRSGRTGRGGREGLAIMLHSGSPRDWDVISQIEPMVNLEHTKAPNQEGLEQKAAEDLLKTLQKLPPHKYKAFLPVAGSVDFEEGGGQHILAAALSQIIHGGMSEGSSSRPPHKQRPRSASTKSWGRPSFGDRGRHHSGSHRKPTLFRDYDD